MTTKRLFGQVARSLAAAGTLIAIVVGVPIALGLTVGWPLPHAVPRPGDIRTALGGQSIDDAVLLKALALVCWVAWAQFVSCVAVEMLGWRRGRAARSVPLAGALQPLVAQLVVAAALLLHVVRPQSSPVVLLSAAPVVHVDQSVRISAAAPTVTEAPEPTAGTYVVKPRDDLWSLAEEHLGSGHRWRELFELNRGRLQPQGDALRRPNLVRPGWILEFPNDAVGLTHGDRASSADEGLSGPAATQDQAPVAAAPTTEPAKASAPAPTVCPEPSSPPAANTSTPTPPPPPALSEQPPPVPAPILPEQSPAAQEPSKSHPPEHKSGHDVAVGVLGAGLLAAGVVTTLDRLRRAQQRRRPPQRAVRMPSVAAIPTEIAVRRAAAVSPASRLDLALRAFARCAATRNGANPPSLSAVQVGSAGIEILLSEPVGAESGPFTVSAAGQVWTLPSAVADATLEEGTSEIGAPLPALVSVGALGDSTVLVDLEAAGCTALAGDEEAARTAFRAMALELATSIWADTLDVLVIAEDDEPFQTLERVRLSPSLAEILPEVEATTGALSDALAGIASPTTFDARLGGTAADGWVPTVVLCANPESEPDAFSQLLALAGAGARGLAVVAVGDITDAGRILRFDKGAVEVGPPGVTLTVIGPTSQQMADVEEILASAADRDGVEREISEEPDVASVTPPNTTVLPAPYVDDEFDVLVRLLGPVEVEGCKEPIDRRKAVELVVYLATHPKGLDDEQLRTALWPDGAPQASFNTTVTRARSRLGTAADGSHHLPHVVATGGIYRVGPRVTTDFALLERRLRAARAAAPDVAVRTLRAALEFVRGVPFAGVRQGYEWAHAEGFVARTETVVADAAHHLAQLALEARDPELAQWAACQGLLASPGDEVLYRDRMLACDLAGNPAGVEAVMDELVAAVEAVEPYDTLHAETVALYERLSHRRRRTG